MLSLTGIGFVIAGIAGLLGFPLAIGAFFAGLAFSHDATAIRIESSFESISELFTPFFFIHIGFLVSPSALAAGIPLGGALLTAAVLGKILGTVPPAKLGSDWSTAWIMGVSMVPRSEIALLVVQTASTTHPAILSPGVLSGMVLVCAVTSVLTPPLLHPLLSRHARLDRPQSNTAKGSR